MAEEIVNKVAQAEIEQIDLASFKNDIEIVAIDLKEQLIDELVLKEKDFRTWVKNHDWSIYTNKIVTLYCSNNAIIPAWAFMLVTANLSEAEAVYFGNKSQAEATIFFDNLNNWEVSHLTDKRVMVKGCSNVPSPNRAYIVLTAKLQEVVKSLMFGEPCSAVPVYKKR